MTFFQELAGLSNLLGFQFTREMIPVDRNVEILILKFSSLQSFVWWMKLMMFGGHQGGTQGDKSKR